MVITSVEFIFKRAYVINSTVIDGKLYIGTFDGIVIFINILKVMALPVIQGVVANMLI